MEIILPEGWTHPKRYNHAIVADGRLVFVAGQIAVDAQGAVVADGFVAQVEQVLRNLVTVLAAAQAKPEHLTRMVWYVTDIDAYRTHAKEIGAAYRSAIGTHLPTMAMVEVGALVYPEVKVEIEAMAVIPHAATG